MVNQCIGRSHRNAEPRESLAAVQVFTIRTDTGAAAAVETQGSENNPASPPLAPSAANRRCQAANCGASQPSVCRSNLFAV